MSTTYYATQHITIHGETFEIGDKVATVDTEKGYPVEFVGEAVKNGVLSTEQPDAVEGGGLKTFSPGANGDNPPTTGPLSKAGAEANKQETFRKIDQTLKGAGLKDPNASVTDPAHPVTDPKPAKTVQDDQDGRNLPQGLEKGGQLKEAPDAKPDVTPKAAPVTPAPTAPVQK